MRSLIFLLCIATSSPVFAQESRMKLPEPAAVPPQLQLFGGLEARWEKGDSQELEQRNPTNFSFAYRTKILSVLFEYSKFSESSGNASLSTDRTHEEMMLWGRWHFLRFENESIRTSMYGGLGVGAYQEKVEIRSEEHTSELQSH
mgnify:CR=1 FL=1